MAKGYVKLHRDIMESNIWRQKPSVVQIYLHLIMKANHRTVVVNRKVFNCGEHITSYENLMEELKMSRETVWSGLKYLRDEGYIELLSKSCTHVKIVDYKKWQK
jgi:DNA-binding transcriptional regulator YhcF (GntR family)